MAFYRNLFAFLCFFFFALALATQSPYAYWGALMSGCFSRAAVRKKWPDPPFAKKMEPWLEKLGSFRFGWDKPGELEPLRKNEWP